LGEGDLAAVRRLRAELRAVYEVPDEEGAAALLNRLLARGTVTPQLAPSAERDRGPAGRRLALRIPDGAPWLERLTAAAAIGLAEALARYGKGRLRTCVAVPCQDVFLDTSRNGSRRFCGERCANRHNVSAFRARRREP